MSTHEIGRLSPFARAVLIGGAVAGVLDGLDAVVAFKVVLGFGPVPIYQFVASGMLGPGAFAGGAATALLGVAIHFLIAFTAALVFVAACAKVPRLARSVLVGGAAFGVAVWAFMSFVVVPLSRVAPSPFSLPLFVNGVLGHALFVGVPIAYVARRYLGSRDGGSGGAMGVHLGA